MAYDVARVRGLHPALGDGWTRFDAQAGMLIPESVATTVSTAFRGSTANTGSPHPAAVRSTAMLDAARRAIADLVNGDPAGVVLGADRSILLTHLADASASRAGIGSEVVVSRLDDVPNVTPWLRAANRYGAKVKWAEIDIETCELPVWQWESLISSATRLVAVTSASSTIGTVTDLGNLSKLVHSAGGTLVIDHSAAAPYLQLDIRDVKADVVALDASTWGGPPIGALVFRNPDLIDTFGSVSINPYATGPARLELGRHQYGLLAGVVASVEYLAGLDEEARGSRRDRLAISMRSAGSYLNQLYDYLIGSLRSMPRVMIIGASEVRIPVVSFAVNGVTAALVVQRLADNGILAVANTESSVCELIGVNELGGAVTVALAHYSTAGEVDHLVRALASLG